MKPISDAWLCHIDITNICGNGCAYCTRYDRHIRKDQRYSMDLDFFEKAILSLEGFRGKIGIMGGEPIYHPKFEELCLRLQDLLPPEKRKRIMIWVSDGALYREKYVDLIAETFGKIASFNEHNEEQIEAQQHQPSTIAIGEVVAPGPYREELIYDCWVQKIWCPSITNKGAFFCEVAASLDTILDGPGGYEVEPEWWKRTPGEFQDQVDRYCLHCGMAVPMSRQYLKDRAEKMTPGLLSMLKSHNLPGLGKGSVEIFDRKLGKEEIEEARKGWDPANFRGDAIEDGTLRTFVGVPEDEK